MRTLTVAKKVIKQLIGDKRSLALLFVAPIFVLFLLSIILNSSIDKPNLVVSSNIPSELNKKLSNEANIEVLRDFEKSLEDLKSKNIDGIINYNDNKLKVTIEGTDNSINSAVNKVISKSLGDYTKEKMESSQVIKKLGVEPMESEFSYLNKNENMSTFDSIAPMMMGFFIFFFVFLLAGVSFLGERISGTLDRLLATPIKRMEIVLGYFFGFGIFVILQTIIIQLFMIYGLGIEIKGSAVLVLIINLLLAAGSLSLGTLLSAFAKNEFQLFQFIPVIIVPQILFSGLFSLREAPILVVVLSKIFPLTYGANALSAVVLRGEGIEKVYIDVLIIAAYAVLFIILNSLALKKYRKL